MRPTHWLKEKFSKATRLGTRLERVATGHRSSLPAVEQLPDWQLEELNTMLGWNCYLLDSEGRRFGQAHSAKKRSEPEMIPDRRILMMNERFPLEKSRVLEFGCFEGIHTSALARLAATVTAVDARMENVVKTLVRLGFMDLNAKVRVADVENLTKIQAADLQSDYGHHVGVLYHLKDPVAHLKMVGRLCPKGLMLDTHYATAEMANRSYSSEGVEYGYHHFVEKGGYAGVFSGMYDHAKWLTLAGIELALHKAGYTQVEVIEKRSERNGPRCLLFASA